MLGSAMAIPAAAAAAPISEPIDEGMTAALTEGPYYRFLDLLRHDITEGATGIPLEIRLRVLDVRGRVATGALIDVWHCDAQGKYSGFDPSSATKGTATTYLRGTQVADANGIVSFLSIYPGWYRGRTTHVHFKVRTSGRTNLTSQFFLPDALSEFLYTQAPQYRRDAVRDTLNSTDGIAIEGGETVRGTVREFDGRYVAELDVRVDLSAVEAIRPGPPGGPPPPGFGPGGVLPRGSGAPTPRDVGMTGHPPGPPPPGIRFGPPPGGERKTSDGPDRIVALLPGAPKSALRRPSPPDADRRGG